MQLKRNTYFTLSTEANSNSDTEIHVTGYYEAEENDDEPLIAQKVETTAKKEENISRENKNKQAVVKQDKVTKKEEPNKTQTNKGKKLSIDDEEEDDEDLDFEADEFEEDELDEEDEDKNEEEEDENEDEDEIDKYLDQATKTRKESNASQSSQTNQKNQNNQKNQTNQKSQPSQKNKITQKPESKPQSQSKQTNIQFAPNETIKPQVTKKAERKDSYENLKAKPIPNQQKYQKSSFDKNDVKRKNSSEKSSNVKEIKEIVNQERKHSQEDQNKKKLTTILTKPKKGVDNEDKSIIVKFNNRHNIRRKF